MYIRNEIAGNFYGVAGSGLVLYWIIVIFRPADWSGPGPHSSSIEMDIQ